MQQRNYQRYLTPIRTYFTRWLIRTNSHDLTRTIYYDLSKPQWRVGLGVGLGVGHFTVWRRAEMRLVSYCITSLVSVGACLGIYCD